MVYNKWYKYFKYVLENKNNRNSEEEKIGPSQRAVRALGRRQIQPDLRTLLGVGRKESNLERYS
jgi:peptidyl-tRNA hydrolase